MDGWEEIDNVEPPRRYHLLLQPLAPRGETDWMTSGKFVLNVTNQQRQPGHGGKDGDTHYRYLGSRYLEMQRRYVPVGYYTVCQSTAAILVGWTLLFEAVWFRNASPIFGVGGAFMSTHIFTLHPNVRFSSHVMQNYMISRTQLQWV